MARMLPVLILATALSAASAGDVAWAQQQSQPPSGPRDRRPRPSRPSAGQPEQAQSPPADGEAAKPPRQRRLWPGRGSVVVVPPSELSSSTDRTRSDGPGLQPQSALTSAAAMVGFDEARLKAALGSPELARSEGQGAMWTYRLKSCALHVFLARDATGALRVKGASSGPLKRGVPAPSVDACVAEADQAHG
ncbi:MAG: hypothetical protein K1X35_14285 [Caulobacteraceae bacterium]|nr:hypothetical protein [Caulobacteraceae bacterium]